jgi:hypothetical protein
VIPTLDEFDFEYGPCPRLLEKVLDPIFVNASTSLMLHQDPKASLSVDGRTMGQWCLDAALGQTNYLFSRQWVLMSCPCLHETCIARCCYDGYRLDVKKYNNVFLISDIILVSLSDFLAFTNFC